MKITGIVVSVLGGLLLLSATNLALTQYNLSSTHDGLDRNLANC